MDDNVKKLLEDARRLVEESKQARERIKQLANEERWSHDAHIKIPQAKKMLGELQTTNKNFEEALLPERLEACREQLLVYLQWFQRQDELYPGAPWLLQNGARTMIDNTHNRYNELLYKLAKRYYGKSVLGWIDKKASNYQVIKEHIEKEIGFDDEEVRDLRKALHIGK